MRITLVEDDHTMRRLLKTVLELEGYQVAACMEKSETDIASNIVDDKPEVVILDVHLASADGLAIVKQIRQCIGDSTKVIMTSGLPLKQECIQAGADDFLEKPFMPDELISLIQDIK